MRHAFSNHTEILQQKINQITSSQQSNNFQTWVLDLKRVITKLQANMDNPFGHVNYKDHSLQKDKISHVEKPVNGNLNQTTSADSVQTEFNQNNQHGFRFKKIKQKPRKSIRLGMGVQENKPKSEKQIYSTSELSYNCSIYNNFIQSSRIGLEQYIKPKPNPLKSLETFNLIIVILDWQLQMKSQHDLSNHKQQGISNHTKTNIFPLPFPYKLQIAMHLKLTSQKLKFLFFQKKITSPSNQNQHKSAQNQTKISI